MGLFPSLLGAVFERLDPPVREVHHGRSRRLRGTASVTRGHSFPARLLCVVASLPRSTVRSSIEVQITTNGRIEHWTRYFGDSRAMRSTLCQGHDTLIERLGPATFTFRLRERDGGIEWTLERISALGIALPEYWFNVNAYSGARADRYTFSVEVTAVGVGRVIRYDGELDVVDRR